MTTDARVVLAAQTFIVPRPARTRRRDHVTVSIRLRQVAGRITCRQSQKRLKL